MSERLSDRQWIDAGLRALAREGIDAVRVERLAVDLSVTKGSFYWHFKDRGALLAALLQAWRQRATGAIIDEVEARGGSALERLRTLCLITYQADARLERAVRDWAAKDLAANSALKEIDDRRLAYLRALFTELGFSPAEAKARARLSYDACLGQILVVKRNAMRRDGAQRRDMNAYIQRVVVILTAPCG